MPNRIIFYADKVKSITDSRGTGVLVQGDILLAGRNAEISAQAGIIRNALQIITNIIGEDGEIYIYEREE